MPSSVVHHIESRADVCGGKPCVKGTRIRVWDVHVWHDLRGQTPEEIAANYPQLTLADVHAALAYFLDHKTEIQKQMDEDAEEAKQLESSQEVSRFARLRDELITGNQGDADSVPSG